jgi:hypothetical protein
LEEIEMSTSRRNFLKTGTMVALATGVPMAMVEKVAAADSLATSTKTFGLRKSDFKAELNTHFRISVNKSKVCVKLVDVADLRPHTRNGEAFSLMFRGDESLALNQDTYVIEHERLGKFSFLLVPMRSTKDGQQYEAVVNRLRA